MLGRLDLVREAFLLNGSLNVMSSQGEEYWILEWQEVKEPREKGAEFFLLY